MPLIPIASTHESLTVAATAVPFVNGAAGGAGANATYAVVQVLTAPIRYTIDGSTPTTTLGTQAVAGKVFHLRSTGAIAGFRAIREGGTSANLQIDYFNGEPTFAEAQEPLVGALTLSYTAAVVSGAISSSSPSAGIGYATGAGAAVTQITNRSTGVTINAIAGAITTDTTSLAAGAEAEFTVTNSSVAIGDVIVLSLRSGATANTSIPFVTAVAAGSFKITLSNVNGVTADTGASIINFAILKSVSA